MVVLDNFEEFETVDLAALQPDVENHDCRQPRANRGQRRLAAFGLARIVAFVLEDAGNQQPNVGLVLDDQHIMRHGMPPSGRALGAIPSPLRVRSR